MFRGFARPCVARRAGLGDYAGDCNAMSYFHAIQQAPTDGKGTVLVALARRSQRSKSRRLQP